ncbi:MAG: DUF2207 domain-containing protein [Eggerthellaceae bacterium]
MQDKVMGQIPRRSFLRWVFAACAAVFLALAFAGLAPHIALAVPEASQVAIDVTVNAAGKVTVHEQRTMQVSPKDIGMSWEYGSFGADASVSVREVTLTGDFDGSPVSCSPVTLQGEEGTQETPDGACYGIDYKNKLICLFFGDVKGRVTVDLTYDVQSALSLYKDVAELCFPVISLRDGAEARDVRAFVQLPSPTGLVTVAGEDVYAWGHGPKDGSVLVGSDGSVTCYAQKVSAGQADELRICFPLTWLTDLSEADKARISGSYHLASAISDEEAWVDTAHHRQLIALALFVLAALASLIALASALLMSRKWKDKPALKRNLVVLSAVHFAVLLLFGLLTKNLCIVAIAAVVSLMILLLAYAQRRPHGC